MPWSHRAQPELQCWDSSGYKRDRKPKPDQFSPSPKIWSNDTTLSGSSLKGLSGEPRRKLAKDREPGSLSSLTGVCCRIISIHTLLPLLSDLLSTPQCEQLPRQGWKGDERGHRVCLPMSMHPGGNLGALEGIGCYQL